MLVFSIMSCTKKDEAKPVYPSANLKEAVIQPQNNPFMQLISYGLAKEFQEQYLNSKPTPINGVFKSFLVNRWQYEAMSILFQSESTVGCRITIAKDGTLNISTVCSTDRNGNNINTLYYATPSQGSGPCPYVCDHSIIIPINDQNNPN